VTVTFKFDVSDVEEGLRALLVQGSHAKGLADLRAPLRDDQRDHAKAQEGPDGKWAPRARATVEKRRRMKARKLVRGPNRKLLNSLPRRTITVKATPRKLFAASKVPWAGVHQHGGTAGHRARIPARPFLWFSEQFLEKALVVLRTRMLRTFGGRR
jgi:phage virion morphogenesis protein